jgi:DNA-3-methyladenine glycosylase I
VSGSTETEQRGDPTPRRCSWPVKPLDIRYHDEEWGVPVHDDRVLFEFLILEGAQAGLSWSTVLAKRENYRDALDGFEPARIARYTPARLEKLLANPGIIRHRQKVASLPVNAKAFLAVQKEFGSFDRYLWRFVDGSPLQNRVSDVTRVPARTLLSDEISADLSRRGFKFVGSTIMYAYMQAVGLVNDHLISCFRHAELAPHGPTGSSMT